MRCCNRLLRPQLAQLWLLFVSLYLLSATAHAQEASFFPFTIDQDGLTGAPDFSWLNKPLTPADQVFVCKRHFCTVGEDLQPNTADDQRIRFFGVNLAFGANFPEEKDADRIAIRLRKLGVNLVRLHHMDTSPDREPTTARSVLTTGPYPSFNEIALQRLRYFLTALSRQGIYVNLNLHVGYEFRPEVDSVPAATSTEPMPRQSKPLHVFHPRMIQLQEKFTQELLQRLHLRDDPVLAMVEINNESSLVYSWQVRQLERYYETPYGLILKKQWNDFLKQRYGTTANLRKHWGEAWFNQAKKAASLEDATIPLIEYSRQGLTPHLKDWLDFLVELDRSYLNRIARAVRSVIGDLVPITGTQMNFGGPLNFDSHRDLDYLDVHFYIDHYNFPSRPWHPTDWRIRNISAVKTGLEAFLTLTSLSPGDRPYTVSEFNQPWPNVYGHQLDPLLAAYASFQDWDAIIHFAYSHNREWDRNAPSGFDLNGDWSKFVNFGQAAWLFRTAAIQPAKAEYTLPLPRYLRQRVTTEGFARQLHELYAREFGLKPQHFFRHRFRMDPSAAHLNLPQEVLLAPLPPYRADTGQLSYTSNPPLFLIDTPAAAAIIGHLPERPVQAGPLEIVSSPLTHSFVVVLLSSLDRKPINQSEHLLLTLPGATFGSYPESGPRRLQFLVPYRDTLDWWTLEPLPASQDHAGERRAYPPTFMNTVPLYVRLKLPHSAITVYPLDGSGKRLSPVAITRTASQPDVFLLELNTHRTRAYSPWYELVVQASSLTAR